MWGPTIKKGLKPRGDQAGDKEIEGKGNRWGERNVQEKEEVAAELFQVPGVAEQLRRVSPPDTAL